MAMITTVEEAVRVVEGGVDIVVAQGSEAGGHRSTFQLNANDDDDDDNNSVPLVGTLALVPQIVDAVERQQQQQHHNHNHDNHHVPVVAAEGIVDGRGLVASLALGAAGVLIGTRFMVARESGTFQAYQERLLTANETDTVITRSFTGRPARAIRNHFMKEYAKSDSKPLAWPLQALAADDIYKTAQSRGETEYFPLLVGQGLRLLKRDQSAAEIIEEMVTQANNIISRLTGGAISSQ
jgi:nitronate monooxygenase